MHTEGRRAPPVVRRLRQGGAGSRKSDPQAGLANLKEQGKGFLEYLNALREKANVEKPARGRAGRGDVVGAGFGRIGRGRHYLAKSRQHPAGCRLLDAQRPETGRGERRQGRAGSQGPAGGRDRSPPGREAVRATAAWAAAATRAASPAANYRPVWRGRRRNKRIHEDNGSREEEQGCSC